MALTVNTNIASLTAQRNLTSSQNDLSTSLQRLSSGLRINSAKDDAAGLAISERFTAQIKGLNQGVRNANDGISLAQTAEGALKEVTSNLQRIRELSVQSANATNSSSDRNALQNEVSQLVAEIERVSSATAFNGISLLDGSFTTQSFQVGAGATETVDISSIASSKTDSLGLRQGWSVTTQGIGTASDTKEATGAVTIDGVTTNLGSIANDAKAIASALNATGLGFVASANSLTVNSTAATDTASTATNSDSFTLNGVQINLTNSGTGANNLADAVTAINVQSASTGVIATNDGSGIDLTAADGRNITIDAFTTDSAGGGASLITDYGIAAAGTFGSTLAIDFTAASGVTGTVSFADAVGEFGATIADQTIAGTGTSLASLNIGTAGGATTAITSIDSALATVNSTRADLGSYQNRFESVVASAQTTSENLSASRSRIMDADFAAETAQLTKSQILQQSGIAMLAQANSIPQNVLALLQ
jgi:flagellin